MSERLSTSAAAQLLLELEAPQPGEEPPQRYFDRLAEAQGVLEVLAPGRWPETWGQCWATTPLKRHRLVECVVLPALGTAWLDLERREWWWQP